MGKIIRAFCAAVLIGVLALTASPSASAITVSRASSVSALSCFGAAARAPGNAPCFNTSINGIYPSIKDAAADGGFSTILCGSMKRADATPKVCILGVKAAPVTIGVIGDSHIGSYAAALSILAAKNNWRLELYWKGGCPFSDAQRVHDAVLSSACKKFVKLARHQILEAQYDLLITTQVSGVEWVPSIALSGPKMAENGLISLWYDIAKSGTPILVIKDNPRPIPKVLACLTSKGLTKCDQPRSKAFKLDPQVAAVKRLANSKVRLVNFDNVFCSSTACSPVIGHVIVYRDANHVTSTFTKTLGPYLLPHIRKALLN